MNPKYSASRFSAYKSCKLKYKLSYIDELVVENREFSVQKKGLVFHEIAENMQIGDTYETLKERAEKMIAESGMSEEELTKYPLMKALPGFYFWWQTYIEENVKNGFQILKEHWESGQLADAPLTGALDVLLINEETKQFRILDYKTGSIAKLDDGYKAQLLLYVYMLAEKYSIPHDEIKDRFKCYLYYPLAGLKSLDADDEAKVQKQTLKNTLEYMFTLDEYDDAIKEFESIIRDTETRDWNELDPATEAEMSFSCSFCGFCGHPRYCPLTNSNGMTFPHSAKVMTKEEQKALKSAQGD